MADSPRLLARDSSRGYVDHPARAMFAEPEAPPKEFTDVASDESRRRWEVVKGEELARKRARSRKHKLEQLENEARRRHVDVTRHVAAIDKELSAMQSLVWPA